MINTGFYDISGLSLNDLKQFYLDCIANSEENYQEILRKWHREEWDSGMTAEEFVEKFLSKSTHNVFVDRQVQFAASDRAFEAGISTLDSESIFLFIFLNRTEGEKIVNKWKLVMQ